ncbi:uncharacterized protein [Triticum aestivum]|uniref:uncharacterized protein n=1 Tax=Triticum aestivum TaxID=4565 RepID=UPI001ABC7B28|nr:uncharacterized protein LOC120966175 [Aegilops tauschii subsp. strangulata]XP_044416273.1 uncharacterized protein LOC123141106 [Triticum aestivum]
MVRPASARSRSDLPRPGSHPDPGIRGAVINRACNGRSSAAARGRRALMREDAVGGQRSDVRSLRRVAMRFVVLSAMRSMVDGHNLGAPGYNESGCGGDGTDDAPAACGARVEAAHASGAPAGGSGIELLMARMGMAYVVRRSSPWARGRPLDGAVVRVSGDPSWVLELSRSRHSSHCLRPLASPAETTVL